MRFFLFSLFLFSGLSFGKDPLDVKRGFNLGVGFSASQYYFPIQFEGETKGKIRDKGTFLGPTLNLGHDFLFFQRWLIGLKAEGMLGDTMSMGVKENDKIYDRTKGSLQSARFMLRTGFVHQFETTDFFDDELKIIGEFFIEGGLGFGENNVNKRYTYSSGGVTEIYEDTLKEFYNSSVLGLGYNMTNTNGAYFELKVSQMRVSSNSQFFKGQSQVNGGPLSTTSSSLKDTSPDPITSLTITVGKHY